MKKIELRKEVWSLLMVVLLMCAPDIVQSYKRRLVGMTVVGNASSIGAYCLDGSPPAYHLDRGFGAGANNWLLQFEGGGWCNDIESCMVRASTHRGSTRYMSRIEVFSGILSNNPSLNPDFYNWNRVKLRYCDGASFTGHSHYTNGASLVYFRGQRIWEAIIVDLLPKGLGQANKALLSGCSAGGLSALHHCDNFTSFLPQNATVKCLSDAGFFLDARDITMKHSMRYFFEGVVTVQDAAKNLNKNCTHSNYPELCFFPQYVLPYINTPVFILNSAYDVFQINHILVPPAADPHGYWYSCKFYLANCCPVQLNTLQGFRKYMIDTLRPFLVNSTRGGAYINSCFDHCQTENQDSWFSLNSPRIHKKTIAEAVGDWYFERNVSKEIDCAYPCDNSCQ